LQSDRGDSVAAIGRKLDESFSKQAGADINNLRRFLELIAMLEQLARVMFWLCVGEIALRTGLLPLPAPVTGLILLYAELSVRGKLPDDLGVLADRLLQFLGMLFVPAGVGVIAYLDIFKAEAVPILAAVIGGTVITLFVTAIVASRFGARPAKKPQQSADQLEGVRDVSP
jgi:holin-like protein